LTIVKVKTACLIDCDHRKNKRYSEDDDFGGKKWSRIKNNPSIPARIHAEGYAMLLFSTLACQVGINYSILVCVPHNKFPKQHRSR
jgi:hypothetical protein